VDRVEAAGAADRAVVEDGVAADRAPLVPNPNRIEYSPTAQSALGCFFIEALHKEGLPVTIELPAPEGKKE